jgi:hypothetical protein
VIGFESGSAPWSSSRIRKSSILVDDLSTLVRSIFLQLTKAFLLRHPCRVCFQLDSSKKPRKARRSSAFCEKLLGYFCAKYLLQFRWRFRPYWLQTGSPGALCASGCVYGTGAERSRNLEAVWGRFGQESRSFGQSGATGARYANRARPHKHWRLRITLIWRVGT